VDFVKKITYKDSGVNIEKGYETIKKIKKSVENTFNNNVLTELGAFAGLYRLDKIDNPVLVSGTDGVGTKLLIAKMMDKHNTIGQDLVAMCVNDILCSGAKPLFFLDYISSGTIDPNKVQDIVEGISVACKKAGLALIGGETAEMPGMYKVDEYDLAGFAVGIVDKEKIISGKNIKCGDVVIGLESSGPHSNGYSLIRKVFFDEFDYNIDDFVEELGANLGDALIEPTIIYTETITELIGRVKVKGIANITGGGFVENIPRILPKGLSARIIKDSWNIHEIFKLIQKLSNQTDEEMFNTLNMGIGMVIVIDSSEVEDAMKVIGKTGIKSYIIGEIINSDEGVILW